MCGMRESSKRVSELIPAHLKLRGRGIEWRSERTAEFESSVPQINPLFPFHQKCWKGSVVAFYKSENLECIFFIKSKNLYKFNGRLFHLQK
jgi:hypothetical protein